MLAKINLAYLIALLTITALATLIIVAVILLQIGSSTSGRWIDVAEMSAFGIGYLILISFAAYTVLDKNLWCIPAFAGAALATLMMVVFPIWDYFESYSRHHSAYDRDLLQLLGRLVAFGLTTAGLLCLIPFVASPKTRPLGLALQTATCLGYITLYVLFQILIWENGPTGYEFEGIFTSVIVLTLAGTLATFLLNRFFGIKPINLLTTLTPTIHLRCPRCLKDQDMPLQNARCIFCKLKIKIDIEEPLCPTCGYNLHNLTHPKCPECGTPLRNDELPADLLQ